MYLESKGYFKSTVQQASKLDQQFILMKMGLLLKKSDLQSGILISSFDKPGSISLFRHVRRLFKKLKSSPSRSHIPLESPVPAMAVRDMIYM
jgi:hypothetical protein